MKDIPIEFRLNGKKYSGNFSAIHGSGNNVWHLMDDRNFYLGRLRRANDKWVFDASGKSDELKELAEFFGDYITAWYE
jgi:hypothetical protein